ncbi:20103_t:CDS:2 [Cetraspora pellucida]|uniref:20103_t:CDS:1 n=1 Tax=Cetraspora pellucida TaxID=1433469 RepID=A0A9N9B3E8_9GLOM|nr:20103_t:CDS:2 [Cetraspora pellucida]
MKSVEKCKHHLKCQYEITKQKKELDANQNLEDNENKPKDNIVTRTFVPILLLFYNENITINNILNCIQTENSSLI